MKGKDIKAFRKRHDMGVEELAAKVGVSHMTIRRWESDTTKPHRLYKEKLISVMKRIDRSK